ncbi:MAG: hypothetical protein HY736_05120 [Verrucomicrobia bacterium]|nr:hypothetical protein [Verrucomicrobiota bacterium]
MNTLLIRIPAKTVLVRSGLAILALSSAAGQPAPEQYREPFAESFPIRKEQHLQIKAYADKLLKERADQTLRSE